jgi:hypothetical protein
MRIWSLVLTSALWLGVSVTLSQDAAPRPRMQVERSTDVCSALSPSECCAQMLAIAMFRATGDQVPKSAKASVRLSCKDTTRTIPENACRLIALGRGFDARVAAQLCAPSEITKRCAGDTACKQCVTDLDRLEWKSPARACYALTYVAKPEDRFGIARARR